MGLPADIFGQRNVRGSLERRLLAALDLQFQKSLGDRLRVEQMFFEVGLVLRTDIQLPAQ